MHTQMIYISLFCKRNCIIQIFCIFTIDCNCHKLCQIRSAIPVSLLHMIRYPHGLIHNFYRKL